MAIYWISHLILWYLCMSCTAKRMWNFELLSVNTTTSDEKLAKADLRLVRVSVARFVVSGTVDWNFDADENTTMAMTMRISGNGKDEDYYNSPFSIPEMPFYDFLNTYYEQIGYKALADCSNVPDVKGKFEPPFPKQRFLLEKCALSGDGFPEVMPLGYYKILLVFKGVVELGFELTVRLTSKLWK